MSESINILQLILEASLLVKIVMGLLLLASLIGWLLILRMTARMLSATNHDKQFEEWFWSGENLTKLYQGMQNASNRQGLEQIFYLGFSEYIKMQRNSQPKADTIDGVERKLRVSLGRQQQQMEAGLSTLASIGSVSPYVGLFGTVWGIMNAFLGLSLTQQASLSAVAPGIAEALIATAMGLFAAIPAVLGYNHFTAKANKIYDSRALFCDELTGMLLRETAPQKKENKVAINKQPQQQARQNQRAQAPHNQARQGHPSQNQTNNVNSQAYSTNQAMQPDNQGNRTNPQARPATDQLEIIP